MSNLVPLDGGMNTKVWINPDHVRVLRAFRPEEDGPHGVKKFKGDASIIFFDQDRNVVVFHTPMEVARRLRKKPLRRKKKTS